MVGNFLWAGMRYARPTLLTIYVGQHMVMYGHIWQASLYMQVPAHVAIAVPACGLPSSHANKGASAGRVKQLASY